jgi:hypothetical protein
LTRKNYLLTTLRISSSGGGGWRTFQVSLKKKRRLTAADLNNINSLFLLEKKNGVG